VTNVSRNKTLNFIIIILQFLLASQFTVKQLNERRLHS
jgi:hypothetical protein